MSPAGSKHEGLVAVRCSVRIRPSSQTLLKFKYLTVLISSQYMCIKNQYMKAELTKLDVSNLNMTIHFFGDISVIKVKTSEVDSRAVKRSHIRYDEVTFRLAA
jgi:hypothetical protein